MFHHFIVSCWVGKAGEDEVDTENAGVSAAAGIKKPDPRHCEDPAFKFGLL